MRRSVLSAVVAVLVMAAIGSGAMVPQKLWCEYLEDPAAIDVAQPRLSWVLASEQRGQRQTAYQVLVADSPDLLTADKANLWDSGKVLSDQTTHIVYGGKALPSR
ncbi:MAG TPA: hypothetical protein ENN81_07005, partial [Phycisphaerales bacterium]|nr:hypothetical protein [Phycisphaerales bacterium]